MDTLDYRMDKNSLSAASARTPLLVEDGVVRVPPEMYIDAAARVVGAGSTVAGSPDRRRLAEQFVCNAASLGIDLELMWAERRNGSLGQVCLLVPGAGRCATLFLSGDAMPGEDRAAAERGRILVLESACREISRLRDVCLIQALLEPHEDAVAAALRGCGFQEVGELRFWRRSVRASSIATAAIGDGLWSKSVRELQGAGRNWRSMLIQALDTSYEETLDCPELCGMRETADALDSHLSVGAFDPSLWTVVMDSQGPAGCLLLSPVPEQDSIELVYLGLAKRLRGQGVGGRLLHHGLAQVRRRRESTIVCAVDSRNTPAERVYSRAGFSSFATRMPFVRRISTSGSR